MEYRLSIKNNEVIKIASKYVYLEKLYWSEVTQLQRDKQWNSL